MNVFKQSQYRNTSVFSLLILALIFIIFNSIVYVHADDACQVEVKNIAVAKANPQNISEQPKTGWIHLSHLPDQWESRWPKYHGTAWYRIQWTYSCHNAPTNQPIYLTVSHIVQSGKILINHDVLWQELSPAEPKSRSQFKPRLWSIPASSIYKGENTIWVQVTGSVVQNSGLGMLTLGNQAKSYEQYNSWAFEKRTLPIFNALINLVIGVFCLMVWLITRKDSTFIWFSLVSFAWVIYTTLIFYAEPIPYLSSINIDRLQNIFFCFYVYGGCIAAWRFAHCHFNKIEKILLILCIIGCLFTIFSPIAYLATTIQIVFTCAVIIFILKCLTYPYVAYKAKLPEVYFLMTAYLIYCFIAINDAHFMLTLEGRPLSPYTAPISSIIIGIILGSRLARNTKQIEQFNKTLEDNIIQAKQELTLSLNEQHNLALENARLQERIQLSHDLHDGLGGSIVRSIILLDQSENIEKKQVLSILKLFRNDLRQVIDMGSSLNTKTPATPIEWGAPIRHRFVQLFEEIDIQSTWHFGKQWNIVPTTAQCLNLARVAEEALTNILKHSQASTVSVHLYESTEQQLILKIEDNGIGFDPQQVNAGLHVGLQSMQTRIDRLHGQFIVNSRSGFTLIQVILPQKENL